MNNEGLQPTLERGPIEFILAFVRAEAPEQISKQAGKMVDIARSHGAMVEINGLFMTMAYGTHKLSPALPASRFALVDSLRTQLAGEIKIIHGSTVGWFGLVGSQKSICHYSFIVPHFDKMLGVLGQMEFGQIQEFIYESKHA